MSCIHPGRYPKDTTPRNSWCSVVDIASITKIHSVGLIEKLITEIKNVIPNGAKHYLLSPYRRPGLLSWVSSETYCQSLKRSKDYSLVSGHHSYQLSAKLEKRCFENSCSIRCAWRWGTSRVSLVWRSRGGVIVNFLDLGFHQKAAGHLCTSAQFWRELSNGALYMEL